MTDILHATVVFPLSLFLIITGIKRLIANHRIRKNGTIAKGFVYEMNGTKPIVRFTTKEEKWITAQCGTGGTYAKGDTVTVIYKSINPKEFLILSFASIYMPSILIAAGLLGITLGILALVHVIPWHT